ncbi:GNAT family N-acetyltransferase [Sutcliffiella deserti]|uniref:GNAT family N-acetyltransferase n=1 Tax=Sutcliffiella deserti TaxID=2875501 RepID=UPI001CC188A8|nr:GNAT family N-acetyltransferase [Sutcliffiella deserti]
MQIRKMNENDLELAANFISQLNQAAESHIGYCGMEGKEIASSLKDDVTDVPYWESFILAYAEDELIGVLGFDGDLENKSGEVWGPFLKLEKWGFAPEMWEAMKGLLPEKIDELYMFPNKKNHACIDLARNMGFNHHSDQTILKVKKENFSLVQSTVFQEISASYYAEFELLHDTTFPSTYYSGKQIIERLNNHHKLFITEEQNELSGYIYVEVEPEFGEASIEFFAVNELHRGNGIGAQLLTIALQWIFTFNKIYSVTLCVNSTNQKAINLYRKMGFDQVHDLCFFRKKLG